MTKKTAEERAGNFLTDLLRAESLDLWHDAPIAFIRLLGEGERALLAHIFLRTLTDKTAASVTRGAVIIGDCPPFSFADTATQWARAAPQKELRAYIKAAVPRLPEKERQRLISWINGTDSSPTPQGSAAQKTGQIGQASET